MLSATLVPLFVLALMLAQSALYLRQSSASFDPSNPRGRTQQGRLAWFPASTARDRNLTLAQGRRGLASPKAGEYPAYPFAVLLVSYHKTGHDLQQDLVDYVASSFPGAGPVLTEHGNKSPLQRRRHPPNKPCSKIRLVAGTISVQHAPDLFCSPRDLARILLGGDRGGAPGARGVKIVHLVRNPYSMAVSNYNYHAREPTPEPWVHRQNPCQTTYKYSNKRTDESYSDLVLPTLAKAGYASLNVTLGGQLFTRDEFEGIAEDCLSLYRTKPELQSASFLTHLLNLDAPEGLRLATAEMMIQGDGNGGDILRMANNMIKLRQAQVRVADDREYQLRGTELRVYTAALDDFIAQPEAAARNFLDFVFRDTAGDGADAARRGTVAGDYAQRYRASRDTNPHVTHGKTGDAAQLTEYLRHDSTFGPPLSRIERLVEAALQESRAGF